MLDCGPHCTCKMARNWPGQSLHDAANGPLEARIWSSSNWHAYGVSRRSACLRRPSYEQVPASHVYQRPARFIPRAFIGCTHRISQGNCSGVHNLGGMLVVGSIPRAVVNGLNTPSPHSTDIIMNE